MSSGKNIFFTGASGKAGYHTAKYLLEKGYKILNADLVNVQQDRLDYINIDITDLGQVFSAMSGYRNVNELRKNQVPSQFDAVVHFAAIPRIMMRSDNETFRINTISTYNVIESAVKLGIKKVIFASSETTYGFCFSHDRPIPDSLPIDENSPLKPMDSYALSKVTNEETAKAFQRKSGFDIYGLRIGNVIEPNEYYKFAEFCSNPKTRLPNVFNYIDARDLGQAVDLCLKQDGLGYEVFNVSNDNNSVDMSNTEILKSFYPTVPLMRKLNETECLYSNRKIKSILGFEPTHNWKNLL